MAKHDENKDLKSIVRIGKPDYSSLTLCLNRGTHIGIKMWGKIDFLTHYCGWSVKWNDGNVLQTQVTNEEKKSIRDAKKKKKEHQLTDKTKRNNKKK